MLANLPEAEFDQRTGTGLVVVLFHQAACPPCRTAIALLRQLSADDVGEGIHFYLCRFREVPNLRQQFDIYRTPTFLFFKDGQESKYDRIVGLECAGKLKATLAHPRDGPGGDMRDEDS